MKLARVTIELNASPALLYVNIGRGVTWDCVKRRREWSRLDRTSVVFVTVPPGVSCQDEAGRLWDIVWMLRFAIMRARPGVQRIPVALYVRNDNRRATLIKLVATCGPLDIDDPQPAITVMMPDED